MHHERAQTEDCAMGRLASLVAPIMLAGVARSLFLRKAPLFGRLRKCHILTIHAQDATPVDGAFEPAQGAVDIFFVSDLYADSYMMGQGVSSVLLLGYEI